MCDSGPCLAVPVENHWTRPTYTNCPDIVTGSGCNTSEIGVRSTSFIALRWVRTTGRTTNLLGPTSTIPVSNRRESLVSENAFTVTYRPDIIAGSSGNCGEFFTAQAAVSLYGNNTPGEV